MSLLIDSHAHLYTEHYEHDRDNLIKELSSHQIERVILIGENIETSVQASQLALEHENIFYTAGYHPHHADAYQSNEKQVLKSLLLNQKNCGLGEIGLDYHYEYAKVIHQKQLFREMLLLAKETGKTIVIHNRKSDKDLLDILDSVSSEPWLGVVHCFDSDGAFAEEVLKRGFYISFSGMITFKKADALREVVKQVPLDRMLVETDAPFLTPHPFRGKRNEPKYVHLVAEQISQIKELPLSVICETTRQNTIRLFGLPDSEMD